MNMIAQDDERAPSEQEGTGWSGESRVVQEAICGREGAEKTGEHLIA